MQFETKNYKTVIFHYVLGVCTFALLAVIGLYAYLGAFSRYLGDDYCEAMLFKDASPVSAVIERYTTGNWPRATMRYSNLLFEGFSELLGKNSMPITITFTAALWVIGLIYAIHELRKSLKINWPFQMDLFLGILLVFFSFLMAPNLFQTVYWRSAMMTHFAPLVLGTFLFGFLVNQMRRAETQLISPVINGLVFLAAFIIAGFSEPPTTTMLVALPLLMAAVWVWGKTPAKQKQLTLLAWTFAGVLMGLVVMLVSPASAGAAQEKTLNLGGILVNSFLYSYLFLLDSLRTVPLPLLISALIPFMLVWLYQQGKTSALSNEQKRVVIIAMLAAPFLIWLLIAAGFSPSVYGQGFPVERMRFLARTMMIVVFMLEGALFGLLLNPSTRYKSIVYWVVLPLFAALSIAYPVRAAYYVYKFDVPEYRARAEYWDARQTQIYALIAQGQTDLVIPQLDGVEGVKEMDVSENHWVNHCAAQYYGINSIRALPEENIP